MNSVIEVTRETDETELTAIEAVQILQKSAQMAAARAKSAAEIAQLRMEYLALLPWATAEQFAVVSECAEKEVEIPLGTQPGVDFKLTPAQEQTLKAVRTKRVEYLTANKSQVMNPVMTDAAQKLVSFKVRVGAKATTTTARFRKETVAVSMPKGGLLAKAQALAETLKQA